MGVVLLPSIHPSPFGLNLFQVYTMSYQGTTTLVDVPVGGPLSPMGPYVILWGIILGVYLLWGY